ncbi:MAG: hypothetical protein AAGA58_14375 [Verrucomicrobiota bacterium]
MKKTIVMCLGAAILALPFVAEGSTGDRSALVRPTKATDATVAPRPVPPDVEPPNDVPPSRFAGHYVFSVVDTKAPRGSFTSGVGRMKVSDDGRFIMLLKNPEYGTSGILTGLVRRDGLLVFVPPLGQNVRAAVKIRARGRVVTGLYGRYKLTLPVPEPDPDPDSVPTPGGDINIDEPVIIGPPVVEPVDPITLRPVIEKSGVVIGFRR